MADKNYGFRLNPNYPHEADAIELIEEWKAHNPNLNIRDMIADLVLNSAGRTPEMYRDASKSMVTPALLRQMFDEFKDDMAGLLSSVGKIREHVDEGDDEGHAALDVVESKLLKALETRQSMRRD